MDKQDVKLVKLERDNYVAWKWQLKNVLRAKKLLKAFDEDNKDDEIDSQALAILGSALNEENTLKVADCETFIQDNLRVESRMSASRSSAHRQAVHISCVIISCDPSLNGSF